MNDEISIRLTDIAIKAAMKQKSAYIPKDEKEALQVTGIEITRNMELEPEDLEVLIPNSKKHKEDFYRILLKSPFENNTEMIYEWMVLIKYGSVESVEELRRKKAISYFKDRLDISKALLVYKTDTNGIKVSSATQNCILSTSLKDKMESELEKQYKSYLLDYEPMKYEDGKEELELAMSNPQFDEDGPTGATAWIFDKFGLCYEDFYISNFHVENCSDVIEEYISDQEVKSEVVTTTQIQTKIRELENGIKANKTKGAPTKNKKLHAALIIFNECGCQSKNPHLKFVYECFDFFGFIEDSVKEGWTNKYSEIQYMKSIFKESQKYKLVKGNKRPL